jgi:predicted transposase YdaD
LKLLLRESSERVMRELAGDVARWVNVELPELQNTRVDLLGETSDSHLIHIELQSRNDPKMALRMAEYCLRVYRLFDKFPRQIVLYVGSEPLRMAAVLTNGGDVLFRYRLIDIREIDGEELLNSSQPGDNVLAILARMGDRAEAVHRIVRTLSDLEPSARDFYLRVLLILAGLRGLEEVVEREARKVPILEDILDNKVLGREFRRGLELGVQQGVKQGVQEGELNMLGRLITERFGAFPEWAHAKLANLSAAALEDLAVRVLKAESLEELLK